MFSDEDDLIYGNLTVHALGDSEGILSLESFEPLVKSIKCEPNQLTLNFIDDPTFEYAKKVWDWVNGADDHSFIIVAGPGDCGTNKYRVPYLVSRLNYDEKLNIARLAARADEWKNLIHAYTLNVKSTKLPAHRRIVRRDGGKAFSLTKDLQFSAKVEIGAVEGTLECDNCGLSGYLNVDMEVSKGFPKLIDKALIRVQPKGIKLIAEPKLTIAASHKFDPAPWRVPLIPSIPIGTGITIGGFIKLGTFLGLKGGIEITTIQGSITIETGATVTISDSALLEVDFVNLGKGVTRQNWTPIVNKKPIRITGSASAGLQVYLMPEVELEASALGKSITNLDPEYHR